MHIQRRQLIYKTSLCRRAEVNFVTAEHFNRTAVGLPAPCCQREINERREGQIRENTLLYPLSPPEPVLKAKLGELLWLRDMDHCSWETVPEPAGGGLQQHHTTPEWGRCCQQLQPRGGAWPSSPVKPPALTNSQNALCQMLFTCGWLFINCKSHQ